MKTLTLPQNPMISLAQRWFGRLLKQRRSPAVSAVPREECPLELNEPLELTRMLTLFASRRQGDAVQEVRLMTRRMGTRNLLFECVAPLYAGDAVNLTMLLKNDVRVDLVGRVRYCLNGERGNRGELAIFCDPATRQLLAAYLYGLKAVR